MDDLISVIVPIYNSSKYLEECINSILNQTYRNLEIILINDGSEDDSIKICEELKEKDERIIVINKNNTGVSDTRNMGIRVSKGEYIIFIDSDDIIDSNMIDLLYKAAGENNVDVVRCNYQEYNTNRKGNLYDLADKTFKKEEIKNVIPYFITNNKNIPAYICVLLIKREKIVEFDTKLYFMEDTEFFIRLLLNINSIYFINQYLYYYRYNRQSASKNSKNVVANILGALDSQKKIKEILSKNNLLDNALDRKMNSTAFSLIISKIKLLASKEMKNEEIRALLKGNEVKLILHNLDLKDVSKKILVEYVLLKNKLVNMFFLVIKLKKKLKSIRNIGD